MSDSTTVSPASAKESADGRNNTATKNIKDRNEDPRVSSLLAWLIAQAGSINDDQKGPRARAALAELRHGLRDPLRAAKYVEPHLGPPRERMPRSWETEEELWFYRIASLFAMHRMHQNGVSLGMAFRRIYIQRNSASIEDRFLNLLSASSDQLIGRLASAIALLEADDQAIDWYRLFDDVLLWHHPNKDRQRLLAGDFYRFVADDDTPTIEVTPPVTD